MSDTEIEKVWYENGGRGYVILNVNYPLNCYAAEDDWFFIALSSINDSVTLTYQDKSGQHPENIAFWQKANANASYSSATGLITGTSTGANGETRSFSIALSRDDVSAPFKINVYVSKRKSSPPAPDDGSWTGNGRK